MVLGIPFFNETGEIMRATRLGACVVVAVLCGVLVGCASFTVGTEGNPPRIQSDGITTIDGLGPLGDNDHSPEEYIVTKTLFSRIELMSNLLLGVMETEPAR